jgi:AraC family transcriptional regulator
MEMSPKVDNLPERNVAYVSFTGDYRANSKLFEELFGKLGAWAGPKGIMGPDSLMLSAYHDDPKTTPPEELTVDVCMVVPEDTEVEGEIMKKMLPGGKYVIAGVELESAQEYGPAWEEAIKWLEENNHELDMSRPSYEVYKNNPNEHPEGHHLLDICIPVK